MKDGMQRQAREIEDKFNMERQRLIERR